MFYETIQLVCFTDVIIHLPMVNSLNPQNFLRFVWIVVNQIWEFRTLYQYIYILYRQALDGDKVAHGV